MAQSYNNNDEEEITGINITPMVDVMLVLLIIFMATATYIANRSLDVKLPEAETAQSAKEDARYLSFVLDRESKLFLEGKEIVFADIKEKVEAMKAQKSTAPLSAIIAADKQTPHGDVVKLIDMIRKNGITDFAINVEAKFTE